MSIFEFASKELIIPLVKALRKATLDHHKELRIIGDDFFDPIKLSSLYVEPNCQHYNPADTDEDNHAMSGIRAPVFEVLSNFFVGEYASSMDGNNQQLILADAGMGKTSLLVMLKLFHWNGKWPAGIRCELIKLGDDSLERISKLTDRANTILLLDSLDEDPLAWNRLDQRLLELLDVTKNFRRVVISCRTQFFPEGDKDPFARLGKLEIGGFVCPMFYLSPFSPQQVNEYLEKKYPITGFERLFGKQNKKRARAREILEKMRSLRMRPFLLSNIEYLIENGQMHWNDYSVYVALVEQWLNREEIKIREQARKRGLPTELLPDRKKLWNICEIVARRLYEKRVRSLTQSEFKAIVRANPDIEMIEELEHGSKSLLNKHSNGDFRFSHYSIQEFLVVHAWNGELDPVYFTSQMWAFIESSRINIPSRWIDKAPPYIINILIKEIMKSFDELMLTPSIPVDAKVVNLHVSHDCALLDIPAHGAWLIRPTPPHLLRAVERTTNSMVPMNLSFSETPDAPRRISKMSSRKAIAISNMAQMLSKHVPQMMRKHVELVLRAYPRLDTYTYHKGKNGEIVVIVTYKPRPRVISETYSVADR